MKPVIVGLIGCGSVSERYLLNAQASSLVKIKACADQLPAAAQARAADFGIQALGIDALLADPDIELVLNLTPPAAHAETGRRVIRAGKHLYQEKPLAASFVAAARLLDEAAGAGVRIGCAPDTFLGAAHQACRRLMDAGGIGRPVAGAAAIVSHGVESWHPNPEFFYKRGGGPVHDMGPYYLTHLVSLLGPVTRVSANASIGNPVRVIRRGPQAGRVIRVEVPTTVHGALEFECGANIGFTASWDAWSHGREHIEIYGTEASLLLPDPNFFGGCPRIGRGKDDWRPVATDSYAFRASNRMLRTGAEVADYRIAGLLDMAAALRLQRPHRANGEMALHVLEVLDAFEQSSILGRHLDMRTRCKRPDSLPPGQGEEVFLT